MTANLDSVNLDLEDLTIGIGDIVYIPRPFPNELPPNRVGVVVKLLESTLTKPLAHVIVSLPAESGSLRKLLWHEQNRTWYTQRYFELVWSYWQNQQSKIQAYRELLDLGIEQNCLLQIAQTKNIELWILLKSLTK